MESERKRRSTIPVINELTLTFPETGQIAELQVDYSKIDIGSTPSPSTQASTSSAATPPSPDTVRAYFISGALENKSVNGLYHFYGYYRYPSGIIFKHVTEDFILVSDTNEQDLVESGMPFLLRWQINNVNLTEEIYTGRGSQKNMPEQWIHYNSGELAQLKIIPTDPGIL